MRAHGDRLHPLTGIGVADRMRSPAQGGQSPIIIAAAIAEPPPRGVEGEQRRDHEMWRDDWAVSGSARAKWAGLKQGVGRPEAKGERLMPGGDHGRAHR